MIIKKFFNKMFSEERKTRLREKYASVFVAYDKRLVYREYLKAFKKILKHIIYSTDGASWEYRENKFLDIVKREYVRTLLMTDPELERGRYEKELAYTTRAGADAFPYESMHQIFYTREDVKRDADTGLLYVVYKGNRLYFKKNYSVQDVLTVFNGYCNEQQEHSPHRYLSEKVTVDEGDIVFDIGCSEGIFSLEIISKAGHVYLFEADEGWVEALSQTFKPFRDKVTIVAKWVSDIDDNKNTTIDSFMKKEGLHQIDVIKMDVEGFERKVLRGAGQAIAENKVEKLMVCTYHNCDDAAWVENFLKDYELQYSEGYMLTAVWREIWNVRQPYFVKGVIRARKNRKIF